MKRIVLVQCTNSKRDSKAPARDLYDESRYFRKQRDYAEAVGDSWYIQSAEHGLVAPETVLEPYNTHAKNLDKPEEWAESIAEDILDSHGTDVTVEILGGKDYADPLVPELELYGVEVVEPLRGQGIGKRQQSLERMKTEVSHATLHG